MGQRLYKSTHTKMENTHWQVFRAVQCMDITNSIHTFCSHTHIPGGEVWPVTASPELSSKSFSCSAGGIFPYTSWTSKTEHLVFSAISVSNASFSHLLRAPRLASWRWPDPLMLHTPQDSTTRWGATSSHWLAAWPTVSLPCSWSGMELILRRVWAPG